MSDIIPFGKHKGRSVAEVMAVDPEYIEWLKMQPWLVQNFKPIYNFIIQHSTSNEDTPEHNALQVKFLDNKICCALAQLAWPMLPTSAGEIKITELQMEDISDVSFRATVPEIKSIKFFIELKPSLGDDYPAVLRQIKEQMRRSMITHEPHQAARVHNASFDVILANLFNDYRRHRFVLCYDKFIAIGATLKQVEEIFLQSGIYILSLKELE